MNPDPNLGSGFYSFMRMSFKKYRSFGWLGNLLQKLNVKIHHDKMLVMAYAGGDHEIVMRTNPKLNEVSPHRIRNWKS